MYVNAILLRFLRFGCCDKAVRWCAAGRRLRVLLHVETSTSLATLESQLCMTDVHIPGIRDVYARYRRFLALFQSGAHPSVSSLPRNRASLGARTAHLVISVRWVNAQM